MSVTLKFESLTPIFLESYRSSSFFTSIFHFITPQYFVCNIYFVLFCIRNQIFTKFALRKIC